MSKEDADYIRNQVMEHNSWFNDCIPMIASENLMSPLAKEMLISDFADRYAEGLPGKRYYQGNIYVDQVEIKAIELAKKVLELIPESTSQLVYEPLPGDDPKKRKPDITLAKELLGWEPKIPLAEGLVKTIEYFCRF